MKIRRAEKIVRNVISDYRYCGGYNSSQIRQAFDRVFPGNALMQELALKAYRMKNCLPSQCEE